MKWIKPDTIIEGVTIGLVVAAMLEVCRRFSNWRNQKKQIQYLKDILTIGHENIRKTESLGGVTLDMLRFVEFERILREMDTALSYRTSKLNYRKKYEIQKISSDVTSFMNEMNVGRKDGQKLPSELKFYDQQFFDKLRELTWIKFPKK